MVTFKRTTFRMRGLTESDRVLIREELDKTWAEKGATKPGREALREELKSACLPEAWRFIKYTAPMIEEGPAGSWDELDVEGPKVVRGTRDWATKLPRYHLFYHGYGTLAGLRRYRIGVASASSPLGPWTKYAGNPVLDVGGAGEWDELAAVLGDVMYIEEDDKWVMWYCGRSAAGLVQVGFHLWYTGTVELATEVRDGRTAYAWSVDGLAWVKSLRNPIISPSYIDGEDDRDFLEHPYPFFENGKLYLYHFLYSHAPTEYRSTIGVHIGIPPNSRWKETFPLLPTQASVGAGATTSLADCYLLRLEGIDTLALTVEGTYDAAATADPGMQVHIHSRLDGENFDTEE